jgi:hypothetical protein
MFRVDAAPEEPGIPVVVDCYKHVAPPEPHVYTFCVDGARKEPDCDLYYKHVAPTELWLTLVFCFNLINHTTEFPLDVQCNKKGVSLNETPTLVTHNP